MEAVDLLRPSFGSADMVLCLLNSFDSRKSKDQPDSREGKIDSTSRICPSLKRMDTFNLPWERASKMALSTYPGLCIWSSSGPNQSTAPQFLLSQGSEIKKVKKNVWEFTLSVVLDTYPQELSEVIINMMHLLVFRGTRGQRRNGAANQEAGVHEGNMLQ